MVITNKMVEANVGGGIIVFRKRDGLVALAVVVGLIKVSHYVDKEVLLSLS